MEVCKLLKIEEAPDTGYVLAYTRTQVIFEPYGSREGIKARLQGKEILELHMFDANREYRALSTDSKRKFENSAEGAIECVVTDAAEDTYEETVLVENEFSGTCEAITVVNFITYDDNGLLRIDNYRLKGKEETNAHEVCESV